jgi:hypothetical protein
MALVKGIALCRTVEEIIYCTQEALFLTKAENTPICASIAKHRVS